MNRYLTLVCWLVSLLCFSLAQGANPRLDWSSWELLPVLYDGRIMPLDTLAREFVGKITGRESPTLDLRQSLSQAEYESSALADARTLFPGGKPRKFRSSELLLSWILEPEKWQQVPFLQAKHEELRQFLELPLRNEAGEPLAFVSPAQLRDCDPFLAKIGELIEREREARQSGEELRLSDLDQKVRKLGRALTAWQSLVIEQHPGVTPKGQFTSALIQAVDLWRGSAEELGMYAEAGGAKTGLAEPFRRARGAMDNLAQLVQSGQPSAAELGLPLHDFAEATRALANQLAQLQRQMAAHPPTEGNPEKLAALLSGIADRTEQMAAAASQAEMALYENDKTLRVVPALNAAALDKDRDPANEAQPWLDLQTLIYGPQTALASYPPAELAQVRTAFARLRDVYPHRDARPNDFTAALSSFAQAMRSLGESIEPLRTALPIKGRDEDLIAYTKYPPVGATATEVRYNRLQPFQWSWVINLAATCIFGVYMIGIRRRGLFLSGMLILLLGLLWAAYGFYLRVAITGWAPVTNMYETVIYVPFFVSLLATWFVAMPVVWDGVKAAWRLTAVPGTWEAIELSQQEKQIAAPGTWSMMSVLLLLPRVALSGLVFWMLTIAPYAAGDRTIINLLPNVDVGQRLPDFNDLMTWIVGWIVLAPTVWYLPRVIVAALVSLVMIPLSLRGRRRELFPQAYARWPFCLAATFIAFFGAALASFAPVLDSSFGPLQPVLRDNFWLLIHVLTIVSSYGAGALAWGLGNLALGYYLFGRYRASTAPSAALMGHRPDQAPSVPAIAKRPPEQAGVLAGYVYKAMQVAVVLLAAGTILGALWADVAWGRFWGWDPKEVWALISLLVYLAILHGRYAGLFGNFGLCFGSVLGFSAIVMSWYGVNFVLGVGLHSYGFGQGGQWEVFGAVALNWLYLGCATARYLWETQGTLAFWKKFAKESPEPPALAEPAN
jgi:ABC-type transport system involved in cytochrome c biogenesis permease subunit